MAGVGSRDECCFLCSVLFSLVPAKGMCAHIQGGSFLLWEYSQAYPECVFKSRCLTVTVSHHTGSHPQQWNRVGPEGSPSRL